MSYTKEQKKYIKYLKKKDTRLLACAGSGKTRCILARMNNLIKKNIYQQSEVIMLTFSRFTRDDFINKIETYGATYVPASSVNTIDSFARSIIDKDSNIDVSLLSFKFMKFLTDGNKDELEKINELSCIGAIFVDEAQDLNEIQYVILANLKEKLGITINLVGDPNQNIYQFRKSSDRYLTEFSAKTFKLTKNFRSYRSVVNFSKFLRPFGKHDIIAPKGDNGCSPIMMFYEDEKVLEKYIVDLLNDARNSGINMKDFAILCPTRGKMRSGGKSYGLCFISNILYKAKIKFRQFYEESTEAVSIDGIKYKPKDGYVNILTYMGSKGLEWKYVIVVDANMCLINKRFFDQEKHNHDRYLLYVACSRAIENMYIFSKCYFRSGVPYFMTNPWLSIVPRENYTLDSRFVGHFSFPSLKFVDYENNENNIIRLIDRLDEQQLDDISAAIEYDKIHCAKSNTICKPNSTIDSKIISIFVIRYIKDLFYAVYSVKSNAPKKRYTVVESIIENSFHPILNCPPHVSHWYNKNKNIMTWSKFDNDTGISESVREFVDKNFNRELDFNKHIINISGYYGWFILKRKNWIKNTYEKYLKCKNDNELINIVFELVVFTYSYYTQHYYHIRNKGKNFKGILRKIRPALCDIIKYVHASTRAYDMIDTPVSDDKFFANVDLIDSDNNIWNITYSKINLRDIIKAIMRNYVYHGPSSDKLCVVNFVDLAAGEEIIYTIRKDSISKLCSTLEKLTAK